MKCYNERFLILHLKTLCILPSYHCWLLNIDVLVVSSDGSLFDNLVQVVHAALHSVVLPKVTILNGDGGEKILDMSNDPTAKTYLDTTMLPLCSKIIDVKWNTNYRYDVKRGNVL